MLGQAAGVVVGKPRAEQNLAIKTEQREQKWEYDGDTTRWLRVMLLFYEPLQLDTTASSDFAVQATWSQHLFMDRNRQGNEKRNFIYVQFFVW